MLLHSTTSETLTVTLLDLTQKYGEWMERDLKSQEKEKKRGTMVAL